jgi:hypothetical protein
MKNVVLLYLTWVLLVGGFFIYELLKILDGLAKSIS